MRRGASRWASLALAIVAVALLVVTRVPVALAFPYRARIGATSVLSDTPIKPALAVRIARARSLLAQAGVDGADRPHQLVLTDGGWRWRLLALTASGAFGLRRPLSSAMVFNRSDAEADRIFNGRAIGGRRSLSGTIAHEMTHWLSAKRLGEIAAAAQPTWKREGFADHVAQESTLSAAEAGRLRAIDPGAPSLVYFDARRRVEAALVYDPSIDHLFAR